MKTKNKVFKILLLSGFFTISSMFVPKIQNNDININNQPTITQNNNELDNENNDIINEVPIQIPEKKKITLSFVGDCTLGTDDNFGYNNSFTNVFDKNNQEYGYFFQNVKNIFSNDDLTVANLETTFTNSKNKREKLFNFKGDPSYVNILEEGSVEIVNLANNHTYDYFEEGYQDTTSNLKDANIAYYGDNIFLVKEVDGIKIGFAGFTGFDTIDKTSIEIKEALNFFEENKVKLKIVSFHWGIERENYFNDKQQTLGRYAIDNGADLVIGHHPHVLQGIEEYKGKYIVYSLGNFVFGGNKNPYDKDSIIFQKTFQFEDDILVNESINIIPVSISTKQNINDYQPIPLADERKQKVLTRINKYSHNFKYNVNK